MRRPGGPDRRRARLLGAAVAAGALAALALPAGVVAAPGTGLLAPAAAATSSVTVALGSLSPTTLTPGGTITVTGTVKNTGTAALGNLALEVRIRPDRLTTREALDAWAADRPTEGDPVSSRPGITLTVPGRLAPGASAPFTASGPVDAFGLPDGAASFGPRAVSLDVVGAAVPAGSKPARDTALRRAPLGHLHTFTVWSPQARTPTVRLGVLVPLVTTRATPEVSADDAQTLADLSPTGRIGRLTRVAASTPGLTWAVDPALLLAAARAGGADAGDRPTPTGTVTPSATPTPADPGTPTDGTTGPSDGSAGGTSGTPTTSGPTDGSGGDPDATKAADAEGAQEWLVGMRDAIGRQDVWALPYGDPDLAALAHADRLDLLRAARIEADDATRRALSRTLPSELALPVDGLADRATTDLLASAGLTDVVLAGRSQPSTGPKDVTPAPRSSVAAGSGTLAGLVADDVVSGALARAGRSDGAAAQQRLVAELAAVAREGIEDGPRSVLALAPRDWRIDATDLSSLLATLRSTPWLSLTTAGQLRADPPTRTAGQQPSYPASARKAELAPGPLRTLASARKRLVVFAPALVDARPLVVPLRRQALSLAGTAWRTAPDRLAARADALGRGVDALYAGIVVNPGSSKLLLARTGNLPVFVENRLDVDVRVAVALRPRSGRLVVEGSPTEDVPAGGRTTFQIPVRAIADGQVDVEVQVLTPTKQKIGTARDLQVRVRSDWENRGTAVVGGALVLLLVVGLVRGIRRGRRPSVPLDTVPDPDDVGRVLVDDSGQVVAEDVRGGGAVPAEEPTEEPTNRPPGGPAAGPTGPVGDHHGNHTDTAVLAPLPDGTLDPTPTPHDGLARFDATPADGIPIERQGPR